MRTEEKARQLLRRQRRVRQQVFGTQDRPRLNVFRSSAHIYAQVIDDIKGTTLAAASSLDKSLRKSLKSTGSIGGESGGEATGRAGESREGYGGRV